MPSHATRSSDAEIFPLSAICIRLIDAGSGTFRDATLGLKSCCTLITTIGFRWADYADISDFLGPLRVSDGPRLEQR